MRLRREFRYRSARVNRVYLPVLPATIDRSGRSVSLAGETGRMEHVSPMNNYYLDLAKTRVLVHRILVKMSILTGSCACNAIQVEMQGDPAFVVSSKLSPFPRRDSMTFSDWIVRRPCVTALLVRRPHRLHSVPTGSSSTRSSRTPRASQRYIR